MSISAGKLWGLRRMADAAGRFKMTAVDQRPPIKNLIAERRGTDEAPYEDVCAVKALLVRELGPHSSAMLLDPHFALPAAVMDLSPTKGLIMTLEDSVFADGPGGRTSSEIDHWSVEKIKRAGGDAVKVLAWYRPDADPAVCQVQQDFTRKIGEACAAYDIPFVFELLVYPLPGDGDQTTDYVEHRSKNPQLVLDSVRDFAAPEFGIDVFKLESPVPAETVPEPDGQGAGEVQALFDEMGRLAGRPWVMLSAGAGKAAFKRVLTYAYRAGASGYLAGRAIWWEAFQAFPDMAAMGAGLRSDGVTYMEDLNALTDAHAMPWIDHACYGGAAGLAGAGAGFRSAYPDFGGRT